MAWVLRLEGYHTKYTKILWYCLKASGNSDYLSENATLSINTAFKTKDACIDAYDFMIEMLNKAMTIISTSSEAVISNLKKAYADNKVSSNISPVKESSNFLTMGSMTQMDCRNERSHFKTMAEDATIEPSTMYIYINKCVVCAMERSTSIMSCINGMYCTKTLTNKYA